MKRSQKSQHPLLKFDCYFFQGVPEKFLYVYVFLCFLTGGDDDNDNDDRAFSAAGRQ